MNGTATDEQCYVPRMSLTDLVALNLLAARKKQKLSQEAVAKKCRLSVSYISMLERGTRAPPLDTLESLAKALGVAPLALLQDVPPAKTGKAKGRRSAR